MLNVLKVIRESRRDIKVENGGYLLAAYTVIWAVIFGYILFIWQKQRQLQRQIEVLKRTTGKLKPDDLSSNE